MHDTPIELIMTRDVISISPELNVDIALESMRANNIRRLPVISDRTERVAGMITRDDAALAMPEGVSFYEASGSADIPKVRDVMSKPAITIAPNAVVGEAAMIMAEHRIGALPVVDSDHALVGIITESDLFRHIASYFGELMVDTGDLP